MPSFKKMMDEDMRKYVERDQQSTMAAYAAMMEQVPPEYGQSAMRAWMDIYANAPKVNEGPFYIPEPKYQRRQKPYLEPFPFELRVTADVINKWTNFKFSWTDDWGESLKYNIQVSWPQIDSGYIDMDQHIHSIFERFYRAMDSARIY